LLEGLARAHVFHDAQNRFAAALAASLKASHKARIANGENAESALGNACLRDVRPYGVKQFGWVGDVMLHKATIG
jgi:hypothetical protein